MLDEIHSNVEPSPILSVWTFATGHDVLKFRFVPESYLYAIGKEMDPGLYELVYLRMFIEEETEDVVQ